MSLSDLDRQMLDEAIRLAAVARGRGDEPFGAVIRFTQGRIVAGMNSQVSEGDLTGHAEMNAIRACQDGEPAESLREATMYASTQPCVMCAGAIYNAGIHRVVYATPLTELPLLQPHATNPDAIPDVHDVLAASGVAIVEGPFPSADASKVHEGFFEK